ncbi:MAG: hypothetical protein QG628_468 [Patescibacteria group bacterium]|nr:hypothetical protein [Patescibacteria group bacterium]
MYIDTTSITADVYAENLNKRILFIKVAIPSLKLWIPHCTVRPSTKYEGLWFQMPKFNIGGNNWAEPFEFRGDSAFLDLIRDAAMIAVDQYIHDNKLEALFPGANHATPAEDVVHDV